MIYRFSENTKNLVGSAIREIFKVTQQPDVISFAGGLPAPETFPAQELAQLAKEILESNSSLALQYSVTEGYGPLRETVEKRMSENIKEYDQVIITSGAQQGIDLSAKVLLNPGDGVVCEQPSFIGALNSFRSYGAKLYGVPIEDDGILMDALEETLKNNENIKMIYTIPTFQNPSGVTMSLEKRKRLLELAKKYNVLILEDNPYSDLRFRGQPVQTIKSMDNEGRVLYVGTFSKILSPGLRLGYLIGLNEIVQRVAVVKQVNDVHTSIFDQLLAYNYLIKFDIDANIAKSSELYGKRCNLMLKCVNEYFPKNVKHTNPDGGLFILCTLPENYDSAVVVKKCLERKVAFVPGNTFMINIEAPSQYFRLNYSTTSEEKIVQGIKVLGEVLNSEIV